MVYFDYAKAQLQAENLKKSDQSMAGDSHPVLGPPLAGNN